ncbi:unnamed protein product [Rotaria sordida]|uniref:Uncharacterized protein n=1 Tax=Rotaria sordida TaxID=392033 RepID=A0A815FIZ1_9BILA|nr:unnamed protein product [Rotaria sordida]CAF1340928.1 unnamed protein product [Rotaria sordida]CAF1365253.1 unnamed protein product [Rotaria sordida]CAF1410461.1 unnamed protein product [Rotaria sordida]CAF1596696.1 unnamed protein product [Rotaria sordida]
MSLTSFATITDTLLELMKDCINDILDCECIVYGRMCKTTSDDGIKSLLCTLVKVLESFSDIDLIESIITCLQFRQLDASIGLLVKSNTNLALVGHLITEFRHQLVQSTVACTTRVLSILFNIILASEFHDKFKVKPTSVPYLTTIKV